MVDLNIPLTPDADSIFDQLQEEVLSKTDLWRDMIAAASGSFILRQMASIGADNQFALERAQHEVMLRTARRPSSVLEICNNLGVHIARKIPSAVTCGIARANLPGIDLSLVRKIPAYSRWTIDGRAFFNRGDIVFGPQITVQTVTLYRGEKTTETFISTGLANQVFKLAVKNYRISNFDLFATTGTPAANWRSTTAGLWEYGAIDNVFNEKTDIDGGVRIEFGDGEYGAIPPAGQLIVSYIAVQTNDYEAALDINPIRSDALVLCLDDSDVGGLVISSEGTVIDERGLNFYKKHAPHMRSAKRAGNTRKQIRALALDYPGIIDAQFLFQAELNPQDLRYMTAIQATLLTSTTWGDSEWNLFAHYMHTNAFGSLHFFQRKSEAVTPNFKIIVRLFDRADKGFVKDKIIATLNALFLPQADSLGRTYDVTSIGREINDKVRDPYGNLISYLRFMDDRGETMRDIIMLPHQYISLQITEDMLDVEYDAKQSPVISQGVTVPGNLIGVRG